MFDPYKLRNDFPMFTNKTQMQGHDLIFLDNASTTFKPQCVIDAMNYYNEHETANSARGDYDTMYRVDVKILLMPKKMKLSLHPEIQLLLT